MVRDLLVYHGIPYTVDDAILMLLMINDGIIDLVLLIKVKASMNIKESMLLSPNKHGQVQVYQPCSALSRLLEIDSLRRYFLPLLAYADIFRLCRTSTEIRSMISEDDILIHELFSLQLSFSLRQVDRAEMRFGWREAAALAARLSPWPTDFLLDLEQRNRAQYWLNVYKHSMLNKRAVVFEGKEQGKNRAVVANEHFPVTQSSSNEFMTDNALTLRPLSATPFTKIMSTGTTGRLVPVSSYVAYFEISIHALDASAPLQVSHTAQYERNDLFLEDIKPCVSIGISRHGFNLYRFLPGWDPHSFGFHGDDGLFYCGDSTEGVHIANANECMYGEGDTVGFGIVYPTKHGVFSEEDQHAHGGFFFTKNGKLHAYLCNTYRHFFQHAWFPTIGTDSFNPITFNFGTNAIEPFIFDVDEFERGSAPFQSMVAPHLNVHGDTCFFKAMTQIRHLHASKVAADIPLNPLMRYYAFDDAYKNPRKKYLSHGESPSGKFVSFSDCWILS